MKALLALAITCAAFIQPANLLCQTWEIKTLRSDIFGAWTRSADFDLDGDPDILVQNSDTIFWYENLRPGWTVHLVDTTFFNSQYGYVDVLDMDGDGDTDVLKVPFSNGNSDPLTWNENKSKGSEWEKHSIITSVGSINWMQSSWGDLDGDGDLDLAVPEIDFINMPSQSSLYWLENKGNDDWTKHPLLNGTFLYSSIADLDGDGDLDIACDEDSIGVLWLENQLPGSVWSQHPVIDNGDFHLLGACVDFNGDGAADIVSSMAAGGMAYFTNPGWGQVNINSAPQIYFGIFGDVDGDGDPDAPYGGWGNLPQSLGWAENQNNGANWVLHDIFTPPAILQMIPTGLADIDGDGDTDIVSLTFNYTTGFGSAIWASNPMIISGTSSQDSAEPLFSISPNPASGAATLFIQADGQELFQVEVLDLNGRVVKAFEMQSGTAVSVSVADLTAGSYVVKVFNERSMAVRGLVKG